MTTIPQPFTSDDARWQAMLARDPAAEGSFWFAVRTTGIYCRPSCPAKRPRRENVVFFSTAEGALAAGYRPCRRCRPDRIHPREELVARIRHLLETMEPAPGLRELAALTGRSPSYLQRVFKRFTGLSPRQYARALKAARLERLLETDERVTTALYEAGYGSGRELYDTVGKDFGMTPTVLRRGGAGERLAYGTFETPLGTMGLAATERGVSALHFGGEEELLGELQRAFPQATLVRAPDRIRSFVEAVRSYLEGDGRALRLPLDTKASEFQRLVWDALQQIPPGETRTYKEVAEMIGRPEAVRAVAQACARNPVALAIPCHRVVRTGGTLGGYRWTVARKRELLAREAGAAERDSRAP